MDAGKVARQEEQEEREERRRRAKAYRQRRKLSIALVCGAAFLVILLYLFSKRTYENASTAWSIPLAAGSASADSDYSEYQLLGNGFLKVTRDGASYIDDKGRTVWNQSYEINTPYAAVNGNYAAIAAQSGTSIYICGPDGPTGQAETTLPISRIAVSGHGVVYALLSKGTESYITVFSKEGSPLDISVKSVLDGDGCPVDLSVSPDGTELMVSYAYIDSGSVSNKVVFYNFSEVGQSAGSNRVVGGFSDDFAGHLCGRTYFADNSHAYAFYDGGAAFFSTRVLTSPSLLKNQQLAGTIRAIAYNENYAAFLTDNEGSAFPEEKKEGATPSDAPSLKETSSGNQASGKEGSSGNQVSNKDENAASRLTLLRNNGSLVFSVPYDSRCDDLTVDGDAVFITDAETIHVFDLHGRERFSGALDFQPGKVRETKKMSAGGMSIMAGGSSEVRGMRLH